jgi:hypothetical protein
MLRKKAGHVRAIAIGLLFEVQALDIRDRGRAEMTPKNPLSIPLIAVAD